MKYQNRQILSSRRAQVILLFVLLVFPMRMYAQFGINDPASMEAMIGNHKKVRAVLETRAILELGVYTMHKDSRKSIQSYEQVHNQIDKYKRYFDMIDLVLNGTYTAFHGVRTYNSCRSDLKGYSALVSEFVNKIASGKRLMTTDTLVLNTSLMTIVYLTNDIKTLYGSFTDLAAYMTGAMECSTANLMLILNSINKTFDDMEYHIRSAYLKLWSYMTIRFGYYKKSLLTTSHTVKELANLALARWKKSQIIAFQTLSTHKKPEQTKTLGGGGLLGGKR